MSIERTIERVRGATRITGLDALRRVLRRMRWEESGGYPGYLGDGEWGFASTGLPQTTPEELNALFDLAGIKPDRIKSVGACADCRFSIGGRERGYVEPCSGCLRPRHDRFRPRE